MPLPLLIFIVHKFGGILGPAHPFSKRVLSLGGTGFFKKNPDILDKFDFMETFNSCEPAQANMLAKSSRRSSSAWIWGKRFPQDELYRNGLYQAAKKMRQNPS